MGRLAQASLAAVGLVTLLITRAADPAGCTLLRGTQRRTARIDHRTTWPNSSAADAQLHVTLE